MEIYDYKLLIDNIYSMNRRLTIVENAIHDIFHNIYQETRIDTLLSIHSNSD